MADPVSRRVWDLMAAPVSSQLRNTAVYLGTIVATQVASFALLPLITHFLGPDSYGSYALALAVSGLVGTLASSWMRNVAFRYYFDAKEAGETRSFFWSIASLQTVTVLLAFVIATFLLPLLSQEIVPTWTLWAAAAMVVTSDFQALTLAFVRAEQLSTRFAAAEITSTLTRILGTGLGLLIGLREPSFLLLAAAIASIVGGSVAYFGLSSKLSGLATVSFKPVLMVGQHLLGALPFSVGEWIGNVSDRLVLNAFTSTAVVGIYSAGYSLGDRIIGGLVSAVSLMAWPDILDSWSRGSYTAARVAVHRYFQIFLWLTTGPLTALVVFGPTVVALLGSSYVAAVEVVGLVAGAAWLRGLSSGFNRHFELEKRYYTLSIVTIAGALTNFALNLFLVPRYAAVGAGVSALAARALVAIVYVVIRDRRLVSFPVRDAAYVVFTCALGTMITVALVGNNPIGLIVFACLYGATVVLIWGRRLGRLKFGGSVR